MRDYRVSLWEEYMVKSGGHGQYTVNSIHLDDKIK